MTISITISDNNDTPWRDMLRRRNAVLDKDSVSSKMSPHKSEGTMSTMGDDEEASISSLETSIKDLDLLDCSTSSNSSDSTTATNEPEDDAARQRNHKMAISYHKRAVAVINSNPAPTVQALEDGLDYLGKGLQFCPSDDAELYVSIQQWRAQVFGMLRRFPESLEAYKHLISLYKRRVSDDVLANWCFAAARLSIRLHQYKEALEFYQEELSNTPMDTPGALLAVSRICHDSAKVAHKAMGDLQLALDYYQEAWKAEKEYEHVAKVGPEEKKRLRQQLQDTQRCMGRIHFEMGDMDRAIKLSVR